MKQTALAELIASIDHQLKNLQDFKDSIGGWGDNKDVYNTRIVALNDFKALSQYLLPKEREQMEEMYKDGNQAARNLTAGKQAFDEQTKKHFDNTYTQE